MASLTNTEKRKLEKLFGMSNGYVLDFTNRTFAEFITDSTGKNIYDQRYDYDSGSKANRLRAFWTIEDDQTVGKLLEDLLNELGPSQLKDDYTAIVARLLQRRPAPASAPPPPEQKTAPAQPAPQRTLALQALNEEFLQLAAEPDRRKAGFALEQTSDLPADIPPLVPTRPSKRVLL